MFNLKFSIIMPSYNQGEFIERSILSIINQNYPNTELIIIDGGSTDNTINIIKKYEKHINYWVSEKDNGQSHALNKGFSIATGDIYGWMNSDDIYMPKTFKTVVDIFRKNKDIKICYGNWYSIDKNDNIIEKTYALPIRKPKSHQQVMNIYNQALFWKKEIHQKIDENLDRSMDYDLILRFLLSNDKKYFYNTKTFLGGLRRYEGQKSKMDSKQIKEEKYLEKKFGFSNRQSLTGFLNQLNYRLYQFKNYTKLKGFKYTFDKFIQGYKRRGKIL